MDIQNTNTVFSVKKLSSGDALEALSETTEHSPFTAHSLRLEDSHKELLQLEADNTFPHQHEVKSYFSFKRLESSTIRKYPFLKVLRIGKGNFLELPRLQQSVFGAFAFMIMVGGLWLGQHSENFFTADATITNKESPIAFDGAVYPFAKAPNWFATGGKNSRVYADYSSSELVDAPKYDVPLMQKETWEKTIVNAKITYPIVYLGKYEYDHLEETGSHPAVDIKLPVGTPVYSIANGLVVKSQDLTSGFGKHIVVRHDKVPNYGTIYSSYSHLSARDVAVGDTVLQGQEIGKVGDSGNATTAHIHFQIDIASAAFHPYWPFTTAEANAQKVDFFEAVNVGLGKEKGKTYTIHPFTFIHNNLSGSRLPSGIVASNTVETIKPTVKATQKSTPKPTEQKIEIKTDAEEILAGYSVLVAPSKILSGDAVYISIYAKNQKGSWCASCSGAGTIEYFDGGKNNSLNFSLQKGSVEQKVILISPGKTTFTIKSEKETKTASVEVLPRATAVATPKSTPKATEAVVSLSAKSVFRDVSASHANAKAIAFLKQKGIVSGYADGTFKPENNIKRSEALKIIFGALKVGTNRNVANPFADVSSDSWYKPYIVTAYDLDLVSGYSDGTFKPEKTVTRSEFFKILAKTTHADVSRLPEKNPFSDVERTTWVAPYAQWAKDKKLLDFGIEFSPNKMMTRGEMAEALYRATK